MADNVTTQSGTLATVPASTKIATDEDATNGHVQIVKLAVSTDGSATPLTADNTDGLLVNLGTNNDVTLGTLPDTAAGDLAAINSAVSGTLTVDLGANNDVVLNGTVDSGNSSTTPLGIGAAFTGAGIDVSNHRNVLVFAFSDVASATNGLAIQFSSDNSNWDTEVDFTIGAGVGESHTIPIQAQYMRVVYTNGGTGQGAFRLQTILLPFDVTGIVAPLSSTVLDADQAMLTRSVLVAKNAGGTYGNIQSTNGGNLKVSIEENSADVTIADGGNSITVDNAALSVTGGGVEATALRVTLASDSTGVLSVDDNNGSLTVDNAGTFATQATLQTGSNIVGKVHITDGTDDATVRDVTGAKALDVSIVDGSGNQITSFGGSGGTAETDDAAFTAGSGSGTPAMGFFSTDTVDSGDVGVLAMDASRRLLVSIEADNAGIGGGTQYAVDDALGATPTGTLAIGIRDDALSALTPVEGDAIGLRVDANGALWVIPSGTVTVDGSGVTQPVSAASLPLPSGAATAANQTTIIGHVDGIEALLTTIDADTSNLSVVGGGTEAAALRVTIANDSTGVISIDDNAGSITVDNAGTFAVQSAAAGDVAHDSADSGNPVKVGGKAVNIDGTVPGTAVAENDRANFITDVYGRQLVETTHPNFWHASADYAAAQTNATLKTAPGVGLKLYVTDIVISNGATAGNITLLDGSGGTVLFEIYPAVNGGASTNLRTPIALTANTLLAVTSTTVTTHSVFVSGYIAP